MYLIGLVLIFSFMISALLLVVGLLVGLKSSKDRDKLSPFECGFDPKKKARTPFSLRFFIVTILFLVFDVEIALLLPLGLVGSYSNSHSMCFLGLLISVVLVLGLFYEWAQGSLDWVS